jgi:hypothetical protein
MVVISGASGAVQGGGLPGGGDPRGGRGYLRSGWAMRDQVLLDRFGLEARALTELHDAGMGRLRLGRRPSS